jgi:inhibitor of cysteine peptidase
MRSSLLACLAAVVLAAPTEVVRINLPTDQPVEIHVGQKVELVIAGNPTTGYKWKVESLPEGLVQVGEVAYVQDPADGPDGQRRVGVGGRFIFTLVGEKPLEGVVKLAYARPWEKDKPPIQTVDVKVRVLAPRR